MEFSKLAFILSLILVIVVSGWAMCLFTYAIINDRLSDFAFAIAIVGAVYGEFATATGFYYNKAKAENKLKIMKQNGIKVKREDIE